jgi:hypothetical protein
LLRLVLANPDPDVKVDLNCTGAVVINVKDVRPLGLHATAGAIRKETVVVCRYLSRFFV